MKIIVHLFIVLYVLILPMNSKENVTDSHSNENSASTHLKMNHTVPVGRTCKNDGNCSPGLKCCDAMGGNKCWACCEDVHCEGLGQICWYVMTAGHAYHYDTLMI